MKEIEHKLVDKAEGLSPTASLVFLSCWLCQGMFLWVKLVLRLLEKVNSVADLHSIVNSVPKGLQDLSLLLPPQRNVARLMKQAMRGSYSIWRQSSSSEIKPKLFEFCVVFVLVKDHLCSMSFSMPLALPTKTRYPTWNTDFGTTLSISASPWLRFPRLVPSSLCTSPARS